MRSREAIRESLIKKTDEIRKISSFRTVRFFLIMLVFLIMLSSAVLTYLCLMVLRYYNVIIRFHNAPVIITEITLCGCTIIGTIIAIIISRRVLKPILGLIDATRKVSQGDFSVKVDTVEGYGELKELLESFNGMVHELDSIELFRNDFINDFSHEFKTPMVSIRGFARQLQGDNLTAEQRKEYAGFIVRESERLTNMAGDILLLSKLDNQGIIGEREEFSLDEQIRECILLFQNQWEKKNINLEAELEEVKYLSDERMLSHVWINLISNAVKYSGLGGTIRVECHIRDGLAEVSIYDNGVGMDEDTKEHVFDKFYRGNSIYSSEGSGLGLAIVKRIVTLCGGDIAVESTLGMGSTFTVYLPIE